MKVDDKDLGVDGGIGNFLDDIYNSAFESNGFVLEIGVATGTGSTVAIHNGLVKLETAGGKPLHVSVDQRDYMRAKPMVPWWTLIIGDDRVESTLEKVLKVCGERQPGLIFIDTDHDYPQMSAELRLWSRLATDDTVWLFHDTHMFGQVNGEMVRAIEEFAKDEGWVYEDWRTEPHGLGKMIKKGKG